jgi:hemoglobin
MEDISVYETVGGLPFFFALVDRFYARVAKDIMLRPLYPDDLGPPAEHLALFLAQYWGGPTTYREARGHPRLRMRHAPFQVDRAAHDAWLRHMRAAVDEIGLAPEQERLLWDYLVYAAASMVNTPEE